MLFNHIPLHALPLHALPSHAQLTPVQTHNMFIPPRPGYISAMLLARLVRFCKENYGLRRDDEVFERPSGICLYPPASIWQDL
jgi:hypothetical protein